MYLSPVSNTHFLIVLLAAGGCGGAAEPQSGPVPAAEAAKGATVVFEAAGGGHLAAVRADSDPSFYVKCELSEGTAKATFSRLFATSDFPEPEKCVARCDTNNYIQEVNGEWYASEPISYRFCSPQGR